MQMDIMPDIRRCHECGRMYDFSKIHGSDLGPNLCSAKCARAARAAKGYSSSDSGSLSALFKIIRIVFVGLVTVITALCYVFPKFLKEKNKKFLYAYIILWAVLIGFSLIYFLILSPQNVFSSIKTEIVSTSCETQEEFVSTLNEALSEVSATVIEGEEFKTYSRQARNAVKGRHSTFKDSVYFVRLPDSVNVYLWFKTEDQVTAYIYKEIK